MVMAMDPMIRIGIGTGTVVVNAQEKMATETETGIGRERRTRTRIGIELKRERRIGRRIEIERGTDGERQIKAAAAKGATSTRERPPLVQKKAAVKTVRTSIRKIAMTIAV